MTFFILLAFVALAIGFKFLKWQRLSQSLYIGIFFLFIAIGCGFVPTWLLSDLQSPYAVSAPIHWGKQNAIVLLGFGTEKISETRKIEVGAFAYGRVAKAASLYNECKKNSSHCTIIVSGGDAQHHGMSEAAVYGGYLQGLGVDNADLILEADSMNTWQNAQFTSKILKQHNMDHVLLATSGLHLSRSLLYFSHADVNAIPVRTDYLSAMHSWLPIAYNFLVTDLALHEYAGVLRYRIYNRLGWNVAGTQPGAV